jgi:protoporphyrinogen oxidase
VYEAMQESILSRGGRVLLETGVEKVITQKGTVTSLQLENGEIRTYDHVVSSMPISLLVQRLPEVPEKVLESSKQLNFRNTILVYLKVDRADLFSDQWLYIHDSSVEVGRVTNFRNWIPSVYGNSQSSVLCLEYWCYFEDSLWNMDQKELVELAEQEIVTTGLVNKEDINEGSVVRLPRCYPVYFSGYRQVLEPVEKYLNSLKGLHVIGRYGAYKYNNQDHSILMGMRAAQNILEDAGFDLWSINTDYEVYQESSVITKTGLITKSS